MDILYHKRRLKANKLRRRVAAFRILLQRIRVLLALIVIVFLLFAMYYILKMPQWYIPTAKLKNADSSVVFIQGNNITPIEKIRQKVKTTQLPYMQVYRLDTKPLKENLLTLKSIKNVYIKRYWFPARLSIAVEERTPLYVLAPNFESEPNSALTNDGTLLGKDYLPFKTYVQTKKILTYGVRNGIDEVWDKKKVDSITNVIKAFENYSNLEVKYIDIRNDKDIYVMLGDFLIRLGELNDTVSTRIKYISSVLPVAQSQKDSVKYIDLRWQNSIYLCMKNSKDEKKLEIDQKNKVKQEIKSEQKETKKEDKKTEILKPQVNEDSVETVKESENEQN